MALHQVADTLPDNAAGDVRERARRHIITLVTLVYLLLIVEGALRKWLLIHYGQLLFFACDPLVLGIYWLAFRHSFFPSRNRLLLVGAGFGLAGLLVICIQAAGVASGIEKWPLLAAYGWRNYFLYIPLPFVVGETFQRADVQRLVRIALVISLPVALLVFLQFRSPLDAPINVGFGTTVAEQFHGLAVDKDHTRPMGTFTSDIGQKEFVISCLAMVMALWISPARRRFIKWWQFAIATAAVLSCLALSGSRAAMLHSGIIVLAAAGCAVVLRGRAASARAVIIPVSIAIAALVLYPIVFPEGYSTFMARWDTAAAAESGNFGGGGIWSRALFGFYDFSNLLGDAPLLGYGLGLAGNASLALGVTIPGFQGWAENDWSRHIVDLGPLLGSAFILYRIIFVAWLARRCLIGARRNDDPLPLLLFAFVSVDLLMGEVTGQGTVHGFVWLFSGICIAAAASEREVQEHAAESPARSSVAAEPFPNLMR